MRPYLAIIKDAFREAFHSRVLWIVLVIISLFLLAVAPLTYRQTLTTGIYDAEINWPALVAQLDKARRGQGTKPQQRIWSLMSTSTQTAVENFKPIAPGAKFRDQVEYAERITAILKDLQEIVKRDDLYQSQVFTVASLRNEGKELARRDRELKTEERQRLNRLLLEATFGDAITASPTTSLQFRYIADVLQPFPISKSMLVTTFRQALPYLVDKGLLAIGLLIAIIVTAPAIPQTFDPGSLHLLLSKPVSRSLLYLSKFCGSCAFVLLCATYLFIGGFLVLGLRWEMWEPRLLWCIPIYTFVFAVYYSVAALAALFWRNVIVSILVAIMFWAVCFGIGVAKFWFDVTFEVYRAQRVVALGNDVFIIDALNSPQIWDGEKRAWQLALLSREMREARAANSMAPLPRMEGPVYDAKENRAVSLMASPTTLQPVIVTSKADENFTYHEGPSSPYAPLELLSDAYGQPFLITNSGMYRMQGDLTAKQEEFKFLGYRIPLTGKGPLQEAGPSPIQPWDDPFDADFAPDGTLFVYSRGKLQRLKKGENGKFAVEQTESFEKKSQRRGWVAAGKSTLIVAHRSGEIQLRDPATLKLRKTVQPVTGEALTQVIGSPDGRWFAVLYRGHKLWILEDSQDEFKLAPISSQGKISAVEFTQDGALLAVDQLNRLNEYEPGAWKRTRRLAPSNLMTVAYLYAVQPIYTVCPKPGELYRTVQYVLLDPPKAAEENEDAELPGGGENDGQPPPIQNPWQPVYSSLAFMAVMLAIGCVYMERQEF